MSGSRLTYLHSELQVSHGYIVRSCVFIKKRAKLSLKIRFFLLFTRILIDTFTLGMEWTGHSGVTPLVCDVRNLDQGYT